MYDMPYDDSEEERELREELFARARELGATFVGVADLTPASEEIRRQGGMLVSNYQRAVSVGTALSPAIVDYLESQRDPLVMLNYRHHGYDVINARLDSIVSVLASVIQEEGHRALPVPASQTLDQDKHLGLFSHKLAAHLAGLGWIGRSCLLITPQVGPRARWATVLTDAPLEPTGTSADHQCKDCRICVDICPPRPSRAAPLILRNPESCGLMSPNVKRTNYVCVMRLEWGCVVCVCTSAPTDAVGNLPLKPDNLVKCLQCYYKLVYRGNMTGSYQAAIEPCIAVIVPAISCDMFMKKVRYASTRLRVLLRRLAFDVQFS